MWVEGVCPSALGHPARSVIDQPDPDRDHR
jgi:hypothetical protein